MELRTLTYTFACTQTHILQADTQMCTRTYEQVYHKKQ